MPTYSVRVEKLVQYVATTEVEADSAAEAISLALEEIDDDPDSFCEDDDASDAYVHSIRNLDNEKRLFASDGEDLGLDLGQKVRCVGLETVPAETLNAAVDGKS